MENTNDKLSVEELVRSYETKISKANLIIFIGGDKKPKYRIRSVFAWANTQTIVYDPERKLHIGDYVDSYYCNTLDELNQIIGYLVSTPLNLSNDVCQEDVLLQKSTKRYYYLDDKFENYEE